LEDDLLSGVPSDRPIAEKIAWAKQAYRESRDRLRADPEIARLLTRFEEQRTASAAAMVEAGLVAMCRFCEEEDGGSCCGAGLERHYEGVLLLVNLLLGVEIPETRRGRSDCLFLGDRGCLLKARQTICVNYLCDLITMKIPTEKLADLQAREGKELDTLFRLCERIKQVLAQAESGKRP
jgi:hypothetical protein